MAKQRQIQLRATIGGALEGSFQILDDGIERDMSADGALFVIVRNPGEQPLVTGSTDDGRLTFDSSTMWFRIEIPGYATEGLTPGPYVAYVKLFPATGPSPKFVGRINFTFVYPGAA